MADLTHDDETGTGETPSAAVRALGQRLSPIDGRVTVRTLILMRWVAIVGQVITVLIVRFGLGYDMPVGPVMAVVLASVLLNLVVIAERGAQFRLSDRDAAFYLGYDTLQMALLLYLTGGIGNPFVILLLAPLTVGAAILSKTSVVVLTTVNQACLTTLALWHFPLPWPDQQPILPPLYKLGVWMSLSMASVLIAAYVFRVAQEARRINDALAASQLALSREQRLSALGGLAAAAAHELGTPLGTIYLVAKELARDLPPDSPIAEDIALLESQSQRCREILAELARRPEADGGTPFERLSVAALIEAAVGGHHTNPLIDIAVVSAPTDGSPSPVIQRSPEIIHGLGNLLQNALQFAVRTVTVEATWNAASVSLTVADDGPGFPSHLLHRIGEPYLSTRLDRGGHMGLGIFIAKTLLERTGAQVVFGNNRSGGARVAVRWSREILEARGWGAGAR